MSSDFKHVYDSLRAEQTELSEKMKAAREDAIKFVQEVINDFGIHSYELQFQPEDTKRVLRPRGPAAVKYRTPTGIEWSGKGNMKKAFRDYLYSQGLTEADKDQFLTPEFRNR